MWSRDIYGDWIYSYFSAPSFEDSNKLIYGEENDPIVNDWFIEEEEEK